MKNILIIQSALNQYRKEFYTLLRMELEKKGIKLDLIYGKNKNSNALKNDEIEIEWARYIPYKIFIIGESELFWQPYLKNIKGKDLVIVENANKLLLNYYLIYARHFFKYKLAYWGHGRNLHEDINSYRNRFKYIFTNKCDWWFAYTNGTKEFLMTNNFPENKITVVQNAIDTKSIRKTYASINEFEVNDLKDQLKIGQSITGIFCGAMYNERKINFIIETCHIIKKAIPEFSMIFIGDGIDSYKALEASKSNDWIHYLGPKFGKERIKYFKVSSIQLIPYHVGLGILDSFAMETPIITTLNPYHGPEIEYLKNGINGLITEDNIDDYSQAIINTLKSKSYIKLIEGCKLSAKKYTIEAMVNNYRDGIISCLAAEEINL